MAGRTTSRHTGDTKSRILDAAETLFIDCGYEAMSLRQITSRAEVNLAAVNYHFGSKESLIHSMLSRRLDRLNEERVKLLERFDRMLGERLTCEHVLGAMFIPALRLSRDPRVGGDAFQRALPHLPREELGWRLHFAIGALSGVLAGADTESLIAEFSQGKTMNDLQLIARLASLMVAALKAPLPDASQLAMFAAVLGDATDKDACAEANPSFGGSPDNACPLAGHAADAAHGEPRGPASSACAANASFGQADASPLAQHQ